MEESSTWRSRYQSSRCWSQFDVSSTLSSLPRRCGRQELTLSFEDDSDHISRYNLIGKIHYPTTPGSNVVGEIVQVGQGVKHFKQGQHVVGKLKVILSLSF